jgi:hypothetical protein
MRLQCAFWTAGCARGEIQEGRVVGRGIDVGEGIACGLKCSRQRLRFRSVAIDEVEADDFGCHRQGPQSGWQVCLIGDEYSRTDKIEPIGNSVGGK